MKSVIKSISEAYSMQPKMLQVVSKEKHEKKVKIQYAWEMPKEDISNIELEVIQMSEDKRVSVYVGYSFQGEKLFQYIASSVNVHYFA